VRGVRLAATGIVLAGVAVAAWVVTHRGQSDMVMGPWDRLGGQRWLLPDLDEAEVVVIDRPHTKAEAPQARRGLATIRRTRSYRLSTNADRLRNPPIGPKPPGTWRIVALGDSVTHGWGLAEPESWPRQLEADLRASGRAVEVINAGMPSADPDLMATWCVTEGPRFSVDEVLWARRPAGPGGVGHYAELARKCAAALHARLTVVLSPVSTFDAHGMAVYAQEDREVAAQIREAQVIPLTDALRAAQAGRGEVLQRRGDKAAVVDQETGRVWVEAPWSDGDLDPAIYRLFEAEPAVREALFFDEGHPDAEGAAVMARTVAAQLRP
jgi:lysophospholipase L1-like esterase